MIVFDPNSHGTALFADNIAIRPGDAYGDYILAPTGNPRQAFVYRSLDQWFGAFKARLTAAMARQLQRRAP